MDPAVEPEVKRAMEALDAKKAELLEPDEVEDVVDQPEVAPEDESTPPEPDPIAGQYEDKIAELTQKLNTADGRHGSELDRLGRALSESRESNVYLQTQLEDLSKSVDELKAPVLEPTLQEKVETYLKGIPKDILETYDEDGLKTLVAVAENAVKHVTEAMPEAPDLEPLEDRLKSVEQKSEYTRFTAAVETAAPGFKAVNGDPEQGIPPSEDWIEFLQKPANPEISQETWQQYAARQPTAEVAGRIFNRYLQSKGDSDVATQSAPDVLPPSKAQQVAPTTAAATPAPPASESNEDLQRSDYNALLRRASQPGGLTEELRTQMRKFHLADIEGRLKG